MAMVSISRMHASSYMDNWTIMIKCRRGMRPLNLGFETLNLKLRELKVGDLSVPAAMPNWAHA